MMRQRPKRQTATPTGLLAVKGSPYRKKPTKRRMAVRMALWVTDRVPTCQPAL